MNNHKPSIHLVHNFYSSSSPSGENQVFLAERDLLIRRGHSVSEHTRYSDRLNKLGSIGALAGACLTPWNPASARSLTASIRLNAPDIIHVHNTFPIISPSIFYAKNPQSAVVLTLHNFRIFCPAAIPMLDGKVCTKCIDKRSALPSLQHGCYRDSRLATLPLAVSISLHRALGTWSKKVDAYVALSVFQKELMIRAGLPEDKVHVKGNYFAGNPTVVNWDARQDYIVFVGRLTAEKGVETLIRAFRNWGSSAPELRIVGDGPLKPKLEAASAGIRVRFLGQLSQEATHKQIANARLLVLPSESFETFGLVIVEAFAHGTPVAVSDIGALTSLVSHRESGIVFSPASSTSLLKEIRAAWEAPGFLEKISRSGRFEFERKYTESTSYMRLMEIYDVAKQGVSGGRSRR